MQKWINRNWYNVVNFDYLKDDKIFLGDVMDIGVPHTNIPLVLYNKKTDASMSFDFLSEDKTMYIFRNAERGVFVHIYKLND